MAHAHCMLDNLSTHALTICYTDCFSTATVLAIMRLNVTLYVHCPSCLFEICDYVTAMDLRILKDNYFSGNA
jgi:hypothetical protein